MVHLFVYDEEWMERILCQILLLNGTDDIDLITNFIVEMSLIKYSAEEYWLGVILSVFVLK